MPNEPIQFHNRYTGEIETENVYGGEWLKRIYGNPLGKLALHAFVKRAFFSRWYGRKMDHSASQNKIPWFIEQFNIDVSEFAESSDSYTTFNQFFYRKLKPEARPIAQDDDVAIFPADGRHLGFQNIAEMDGIFIKGQTFDISELLSDEYLASNYREGSLIISRLCPVDYHRYHFPVAGKAGAPRMINGPLYSVNPIALKQNIRIFSENKRAICRIESERFGTVLMLEIGATNVGAMEYTYGPDAEVAKGEEKGFFKFGGSSTILLFEKDRIQLDDDLVEHSRERRELYARMGDQMGRADFADL